MLERIKQALARKIGPLPAGVWLGITAIAIYLYRRHKAGATTTTPTAAPTLGSYGTAPTAMLAPGSGGGGSFGQPNQPSSVNQGGAPAIYDPLTGSQIPAVAVALAAAAAAPAPQGSVVTETNTRPAAAHKTAATAADTPTATGPSVTTVQRPHPTSRLSQPYEGTHVAQKQTPAGYQDVSVAQPLLWGGGGHGGAGQIQFTSQEQFDRWARSKGTTARAILANHPAAARIYRNLPARSSSSTVAPPKARASANPVAAAAQEVARGRPAPAARTSPVARARAAAPAPAAPRPAAPKPRAASLPAAKATVQARHAAAPSAAQVATVHPTAAAAQKSSTKTPL